MHVFLSGPMGVGKSTIGRALASSLGMRFLDLDTILAARFGPIEAFFRESGERAFRDAEAALLEEKLAGPLKKESYCIALGGGAVLRASTREALRDAGLLLTLTASPEILTERVLRDIRSGAATRPLLPTSPEGIAGAIRELLQTRTDAYAECDASIVAEGSSEDVLARVLARVQDRPIGVYLGPRSYSVDVGAGIRERRPDGFEVADENTRLYARSPYVLRAGEAHKLLPAVEGIWDAAIRAGVDRSGRLIAVGGGVVGDLTRFAAATLMRGVSFGLVATSVISMVDSSVGGKTGFNRRAGKNMVGAFHQPDFVLCDTETLDTLPEEEYRAGFAEVVKSAWLDGDGAVTELEANSAALRQREPEAIEAAIRMSIRLKAKVVTADEREGGVRAQLNLGHTLGHGFEAAAGLGALKHGDAVALGLAAAANLSVNQGVMLPAEQARLHALLLALDLPTDYRARLSPEVERFVSADKKRRDGRIRFVVPGAPGAVSYSEFTSSEILALVV